MEGETGTGTAYGSNVQFIRTFLWGKKNEEMSQGIKAYAKVQLSIKRYTKDIFVECGLA